MSLQEKIIKLKLDAAMAARHAQFWQKAIDTHGEEKATAFYKHLGLNHLEAKSFDWEGLKLSRLPRPHEMLAIKGVSSAQDNAKEQIAQILLKLRTQLISDGLKGIKTLSPADYHALTLRASSDSRFSLRDRLIAVHKQGRMTIAKELGGLPKGFIHEHACNDRFIRNDPPGYQCKCEFKQSDGADDFDELDTLTDVTDARVANDVQARIVGAATRFALLGLAGAALIDAVRGEINAGTVSYIDRASTGLANKVINIGRGDEAMKRRDEWDRVEYSALLDQNVCDPCASQDGTEAATEDELQPVPNPECLGGDWCRCFHVWVKD